MNLNMNVNFGDDFSKNIEEFIIYRVEKLDPRKASGKVGQSIKKLDRFFEALDSQLMCSGVPHERLLEFGEIEDLLMGLIFEHEIG